MFPRIIIAIFVFTVGGALGVWAAGGLSAKQARDLLRKLGGATLTAEQVRIKTITNSLKGNAIAEAQIETAVRFQQEKGEWKVADIRLGDHHWESVELITEAIRREKIRRTEIQLQKVAAALAAYQQAQNQFVVADNFDALLDQLVPRYLPAPVRFDLWEQPLSYRGTATAYQLISSGPDLKSGTADDLVIERK